MDTPRFPKKSKQWKELIESYMLERKSLTLSVILLDARRGWMEKDLELKRWLEFQNGRIVVVATKIDKLKPERNGSESLSGHPQGNPQASCSDARP